MDKLYYTNFQEVRYYNKYLAQWRNGLCHHEWLLDYEGEAYLIDDLDEDLIVELEWRNLKEVEGAEGRVSKYATSI